MQLTREEILDMLIVIALDDIKSKRLFLPNARPSQVIVTSVLTQAKPEVLVDYILILIKEIHDYQYSGSDAYDATFKDEKQKVRILLLKAIFSKKITFTIEALTRILLAFRTHRLRYDATILDWPIEGFIKIADRSTENTSLDSLLYTELNALKRDLQKLSPPEKMRQQLEQMIDVVLDR